MFEAEIKEKDTQLTKLEESYKERTKALICASEKFATDLQQLTRTFSQREEEYRRAVDHASDLATKEAKRTTDETKQEIQRELQQERSRRQSLEKELRQAKQDLSVTEENSKRGEQSNEALQKELAAAKLGNQAVTAHLEEKTRALEQRLDRDATVITKLRAALADKEVDYVNLRSSMEAYDEKVQVLIEHLRGWAQDYTHIGAIRSRLEMLGQIDQSCTATARTREVEQIDSVLAQLRQYCARQLERDKQFDFSPGHLKASPPLYSSDEGHDQRVADLSAFLDAEVAACQPTSHARGQEMWSKTMQAAKLTGSINALTTPANGPEERSSARKPPPVVADRVINVSLDPETSTNASSPPAISSPVPKHSRRETRASVAQKAAMRNPVSPTGTRTTRRSKRKRSETDTSREDAVLVAQTETRVQYTETSAYFQGAEQGEAPIVGNSAKAMVSAPHVMIKMEGQ
ncbi:hypothetical protein SCUCBS95973_005027 [Sporothrix curviconia]|uniref:Uncharacterized protein n=1 Tax=Sporothrix curviconia TaxID=1260050 RepID=A0ABP0BV51_9PEZI